MFSVSLCCRVLHQNGLKSPAPGRGNVGRACLAADGQAANQVVP